MFKVNDKDTRSGVFIVNFEHISHIDLVFLLLTLSMPDGISIFREPFGSIGKIFFLGERMGITL